MAIALKGKPAVIIIGAGLTGLLAAQGLKRHGFRPTVYERDAGIDARPREWTMLVHWAMPILQRLVPQHILDDFDTAVCNPHLDFNAQVETLPCFNGLTGDLLFSSPTPGARRVSRRRLRALLARGVDIRWGKSLKGLSDGPLGTGIQACFECGETVTADYVLGTDGTWSKVREMLLGAEMARPRGSGFLFATGINNYNDSAKVGSMVIQHPVAALMMGTGSVGGIGVLYADDPRRPWTWTTFWVKIWRGEPVKLQGEEALEYIEEHTIPLRDGFQDAIDWTTPESFVSINEMKYWIPVAWDNHRGRVTLAGDAAHPMLIYRGQGFQHSITDVDNYVNALVQLQDQGGEEEARRGQIMRDYDDEMIARGANAVKQSLSEAEKSLDIEAAKKMLMATKGHGQ